MKRRNVNLKTFKEGESLLINIVYKFLTFKLVLRYENAANC